MSDCPDQVLVVESPAVAAAMGAVFVPPSMGPIQLPVGRGYEVWPDSDTAPSSL